MSKRKRSVSGYSRVLSASPQRVFEQLCPTREYDWIDGWSCQLVHSDSGYAEQDCVFVTAVFKELGVETWTCSRYEPSTRIEYTRMSPHTVIRLEFILSPATNGTHLSARFIFSSLDDSGDAFVSTCDAGFGERHLKPGLIMLEHFLTTGEKLLRAKAMELAGMSAWNFK